MTDVFGFAHWADHGVVKTGKEPWRRCWAGAEGEDTAVTTRGRVQGDFLILGLLLSIRVSRQFIVVFVVVVCSGIKELTVYRFAYTPGVAEAHTESEEAKNCGPVCNGTSTCGQSAVRPMRRRRRDAHDTELSPGPQA